ncbi:MAG: nucleotidyl transferase AbiEii/AbiGii toxin family protein [Bacilli bacterium]|nr:nucleotidyl transferase AbiEii/AbiGii toxin family protein [Bacilli bacterium]
MLLHLNKDTFNDLCQIVSQYKGIPKDAVKLDYYIVLLLKNLSISEYKEVVVFKGGTSLSKCYPNSIERFSEDVDLTYIPAADAGKKEIENHLKRIEKIIVDEHQIEKNKDERNQRNKSSYVIFEPDSVRIKLEIGSTIIPSPCVKKTIKSYIQEYLEEIRAVDAIKKFKLEKVEVNALDISRTFIDKVMAVKRHSVCDNLSNKVRHIYDVVRLYKLEEIKAFLSKKDIVKKLIIEVKETDSFYLEKRIKNGNSKCYNAKENYNFKEWKNKFDSTVKNIYENLHNRILYTSERQDFSIAIKTFEEISGILNSIGE